ncbi:MAG: TonB family protein, partial [Sphingobacterium sp.]
FVHECQVDTHFSANKVVYAELLISQTLQVNPALLRHDFSNQSILKDRIKMLFKKASAPLDCTNYLWIVPISLLGLLLIKNSQADPRQYLENYPNLNLSKDVLFSKNQQEIFNYDELDQPPVYPGGTDAFRKAVNERLIISDQAIQAHIKGVVEVSFTINKQGEMQDFELVRDLGYQSGDNVITAIKQSKRWTPAIRNGNPVSVRYVLPVRFDLSL